MARYSLKKYRSRKRKYISRRRSHKVSSRSRTKHGGSPWKKVKNWIKKSRRSSKPNFLLMDGRASTPEEIALFHLRRKMRK